MNEHEESINEAERRRLIGERGLSPRELLSTLTDGPTTEGDLRMLMELRVGLAAEGVSGPARVVECDVPEPVDPEMTAWLPCRAGSTFAARNRPDTQGPETLRRSRMCWNYWSARGSSSASGGDPWWAWTGRRRSEGGPKTTIRQVRTRPQRALNPAACRRWRRRSRELASATPRRGRLRRSASIRSCRPESPPSTWTMPIRQRTGSDCVRPTLAPTSCCWSRSTLSCLIGTSPAAGCDASPPANSLRTCSRDRDGNPRRRGDAPVDAGQRGCLAILTLSTSAPAAPCWTRPTPSPRIHGRVLRVQRPTG